MPGETLAHDPGGKTRLALQPGVIGAAEFSACGRYRYWLSRDWSGLAGTPFVLWIAMNPSTAESDVDDPTIRKEIGFTRREGFSRLVKANVMDFRSTSPAGLMSAGIAPCSDRNRLEIQRLASDASLIIVAFGKLHKSLRRYGDRALNDLRGRELWCLGKNSDGSPKHPLYLAADTPLERFR